MLALLFFLLGVPSAHAHPLCPFDRLKLKPLLAPNLREQAPDLARMFTEFSERLGPCRRVEEHGAELTLVFDEGTQAVRIEKNKKGLWKAIGLGPMGFPGDTVAKVADAAGRAGLALYAVREGEAPTVNVRGEEARAVGESVQLLFLRAYREAVAAGKLKPTDVVTFTDETRAFSSGPLAAWPKGTPLTLESAAQLAFRSHDNIASDLLQGALMRAGLLKQKMFTYGELYRMLRLPPAEARAALKDGPPLKHPAPVMRPATPPRTSEVSAELVWRASARELCEAALKLRDDPVVAGDPPGAADWDTRYEVMGFFPRLSNFTAWGRRSPTDPWVCVSVSTENDSEKAVDRAVNVLERALLLASRGEGSAGQAAGK